MHDYDLVIRGGSIVDGTGSAPFIGDLAVKDGRIVALGQFSGKGSEEIDAKGLVVTPGFIDPHTHYDGQVIWSKRVAPSSNHGFTTVLAGNCGVGFAPCRRDDQDVLIKMMEGVEDIPGAVMAEGLDWHWETFPEYLDAIEAREHDIDIAVLLPHSPLRVFVMGQRGIEREAATAEDLSLMRKLSADAVKAGAFGFSTSRIAIHRTIDGDLIPSYEAATSELEAIALGLADAGGGLIQAVPDLPVASYFDVAQPLIDVALKTKQRLTMTLGMMNAGPRIWPEIAEMIDDANRQGVRVTGQIFPRPVGMIIGLDLSVHPFALKPSYSEVANLPLPERVAAMRQDELRSRLLTEPVETDQPLRAMSEAYEWTFPLREDANYAPRQEDSIAAMAQRRGIPPQELMYELLLENEGKNTFLVALANYPGYNLDEIYEILQRNNICLGLGDGGAHYGMICDSSYSSFMLQYWVRERSGKTLPLERVVQMLTAEPADIIGLPDRGKLAPGLKADINIIDADNIRLHAPKVVFDLPSGGRRLDQSADGFIYTFVNGRCIAHNGRSTGELPGKLLRSRNFQ